MHDIPPPLTLHASAVAFDRKAVVIVGASGAGKSSLALQLMSFGARLVGDDRVTLKREAERLTVSPAPQLENLIEARGLGILRAEAQHPSHVSLCVDLDQTEHERYPPHRSVEWLGLVIPCIHKVENVAFPSAVKQYLLCGRAEV